MNQVIDNVGNKQHYNTAKEKRNNERLVAK